MRISSQKMANFWVGWLLLHCLQCKLCMTRTNTSGHCWPGHHNWVYKCMACSVTAETFPCCVGEWNTETFTTAPLQALLMGLEDGVRSTSTLGYIRECSCAQHRQQRRSPRLPQLLHRSFLKKPMQGLMSRWVGCNELSAHCGACSRPISAPLI